MVDLDGRLGGEGVGFGDDAVDVSFLHFIIKIYQLCRNLESGELFLAGPFLLTSLLY